MPTRSTLARYQSSIQESIEMVSSSDYRNLPDKTLKEDLLIAQSALQAVQNVLDKTDEIESNVGDNTIVNVICMAITQEFRNAVKDGLL